MGNQEFSQRSRGKVSGCNKPALSPGTQGFHHEDPRESRRLCSSSWMAGSHPPTVEAPSGAGATARSDQDARLPVLRAPVLPRLLHRRERAGYKVGRTRVETEHGVGGRKGRKEVAGPRLRTALHPSPSGARAQQSQFRGGKSVSNLSADLYFLRAFWLMKT